MDDWGQFVSVDSVGEKVAEVQVHVGPAFLQLFSEQMYTSANKAFEELVSNSWDAGATATYIHMSDDLNVDGASAWVLDNGESMDVDGLQALWNVANSTKPQRTEGRPQIGKFGIGKLATYVLAHCLTYVCRAQDGVVRAVTMDYRRIEESGQGLHIDSLPLSVRKLDKDSLEQLVGSVDGGQVLLELIANEVQPQETDEQFIDEFGGDDPVVPLPTKTWTAAILTDLRPVGTEMQPGRIRRMLRAALPLGSSMQMTFNGEVLTPTKIDVPEMQAWSIGPDLGIESVSVSDDGTEAAVTSGSDPYPYVEIDGVPGRITGSVRLYEERISGGKSDTRGSSNGFFVNILGRVVNGEDPYFGLENLNHSVWAQFRTTVRADGLNAELAVSREDLRDSSELRLFRALLRAIFNKARSHYDSVQKAAWPEAGKIITDAWGAVPLDPLRRLIDRSDEGQLPSVLDFGAVQDISAVRAELAENEAKAIEDVEFSADRAPSDPLVSYDVASRKVLLNNNHPFILEYSSTHEQQLLLRDTALVDFLADVYLADLGVPGETLEEAAVYKDQMLRLVARIRRRTPANLAELLEAVAAQARPLELIVGDALENLGFVVTRMGQPGKPEGVAVAPVTRSTDGAGRYSFTYDTKSTINSRVRNGNVGVSTLVRHRDHEKADHTLVVAPDFESGALEEECERDKVTPMRIADLARLLVLNATHGPVDPTEFKQIFNSYSPNTTAEFVDVLAASHKDQRRLSYQALFDALAVIGYEEPDVLTTAVIAREMRQLSGDSQFPTDQDVSKLVTGLSMIAPRLIRTTGKSVYLSAQPTKLREAVLATLSSMPPEYRIDLEASS